MPTAVHDGEELRRDGTLPTARKRAVGSHAARNYFFLIPAWILEAARRYALRRRTPSITSFTPGSVVLSILTRTAFSSASLMRDPPATCTPSRRRTARACGTFSNASVVCPDLTYVSKFPLTRSKKPTWHPGRKPNDARNEPR